jgi:hypothetical protein
MFDMWQKQIKWFKLKIENKREGTYLDYSFSSPHNNATLHHPSPAKLVQIAT